VSHDDTVSQGVYFLTRELGLEEAKVFFDEAYNKGYAVFQDRMGYKYKLIYSSGQYQLVKP
jgi:hypothetical protein